MPENKTPVAEKTDPKSRIKNTQGQRTRTDSGQRADAQRRVQKQQRPSPQMERINTILWVIPLISVFLLLWMIIVNMGLYDFSETTGLNNEQWFMLSVFIIIILFIIMILSVIGTVLGEPQRAASAQRKRPSQNREVLIEAVPEETGTKTEPEKSDDAKAVVATEPVSGEKAIAMEVETVVEVKDVEAEKTAKITKDAKKVDGPISNIIEYPINVSGGLYGDTYIKLDKKRILKLRTLIVEDYYLI